MNSTAASLLGLLDASDGELTGGELVRVAQERIGQFWSLTRSQVYRELAALQGEGLVEDATPGPREAKPVRITPAGRAAYRDWFADALPGETIRIPVLLAVAFGGALDATALRKVLNQSKKEHRARLEEYQALDAALAEAHPEGDPWGRATLTFGLLYEKAVMQWFTTLPDSVRPD